MTCEDTGDRPQRFPDGLIPTAERVLGVRASAYRRRPWCDEISSVIRSTGGRVATGSDN